MWPRAEAHGNPGQRTRYPGVHRASMWPRAEAHENARIFGDVGGRNPASMWPRAEAHGNVHKGDHVVVAYFALQCGRGPKPTEIGDGTSPDRRRDCFNVAAGRSPRKSRLPHT